MGINDYIEFFDIQLMRWENPINVAISPRTKEFLVKIGLPSNKSISGSSFFPLVNKNQILSIDRFSYFIIACVSNSEDGNLFLAVESNSDKIYFINSLKNEIYFVNSHIECLAFYLTKFCLFFNALDIIGNKYDNQLQTYDLTQFQVNKEFKLLAENLLEIDKAALIEGKFWHKFWISNFLLSYMEFISSVEAHSIIDQSIDLASGSR